MNKFHLARSLVLAGNLLLQLLSLHSHAAPGDVDLSFDPGSGVNGEVKVLALQTDGKVLIGGGFSTVRDLARFSLARLNPDGSGDATFDAGTNADSLISAVALQPDGRIIFTRDFYNVTGAPPGHKVARLNTNGTLDSSFVPAIGAFPHGSGFTCMAVQPDGRLVLGGYFNDQFVDEDGFVYYHRRSLLIRLNADGTTDNGFTHAGGTLGGQLSAVTLQPDGKLLVAGDIVTVVNGTNYSGIARLHANGNVDTNFTSGVEGFIRSLGLQSDGRILVAGNYIGRGTNRNAIARLTSQGIWDGTFLPGIDGNSSLVSTAVQPDGKIVCSGGYIYVNGTSLDGLVRLNIDGSVDLGFRPTSGAPNNSGAAIALQPDGRILLGGGFTLINSANRERVARLKSDGTLDNSFHPGSSINAAVNSLSLQADGKVLIGGDFTLVDGAFRSRVARLNANGALDSSFDPGTGIAGAFFLPGVFAVTSQPDGKVLVGGDFTSFNGVARNRLARLNADGSVDAGFVPGIGWPLNAYSLQIDTLATQPDGKILIGGDPSLGTGTNANGIARLNVDGSRDVSFHPDTIGTTGCDSTRIHSLAIQPDGKILAGGGFVHVVGDAHPEFLLTRLNPDGSRDTQFTEVTNAPGSEMIGNVVSSITLQADGKILAATSSYYGPTAGIWRFNNNGTVDDTFNFGQGADGAINSIALQADGKILIGGSFTRVSGFDRSHIARLNSNGSLDTSFEPGGGTSGIVRWLTLRPDGNLLIAGAFTTVNGVVRPCVALLLGNAALPSLSIVRSNAFVTLSWPTIASNVQLQETTNLALAAAWAPVTQPRVTNGARILVTLPASAEGKFFRLKSE